MYKREFVGLRLKTAWKIEDDYAPWSQLQYTHEQISVRIFNATPLNAALILQIYDPENDEKSGNKSAHTKDLPMHCFRSWSENEAFKYCLSIFHFSIFLNFSLKYLK